MAEKETKNIDFKNEEIRSPEQLNDYLRVTNPRIWAIFVIIFLIIAAFFAWACAGTIETVTDAKAVVSSGKAELIVINSEPGTVQKGMTVRVNDEEFKITDVTEDDYGRTIAYAPVSLLDGSYDAKIVVESITPISFLMQD